MSIIITLTVRVIYIVLLLLFYVYTILHTFETDNVFHLFSSMIFLIIHDEKR